MDEAVSERKFVKRAIVQIGTALTLFYILAIFADWYRTHPWIDIPQHFFGGVLAGLVFYAIVYRFPDTFNLKRNYPFTSLLLLGVVALGGAIWEFIEFTYDATGLYQRFGAHLAQLSQQDTMGDLLMDLVGGLVLAIFMRLRYDKRKRQL